MCWTCHLKTYQDTSHLAINSSKVQFHKEEVCLFIGNIIFNNYFFSYAGISRSSSVIIAYLMQEQGM